MIPKSLAGLKSSRHQAESGHFSLDAPFLVKSNSHQVQISKYNLQRLTDIFGSEQLKAI